MPLTLPSVARGATYSSVVPASGALGSLEAVLRIIMLNAVAIYHRTKKVRDEPWNTFVCRPIAAVFVQLLAGTRITPNQVTLSSLCLALVAAGLLIGVPGRAGLVIGIVVYELSYVLDCVDGMLARYRGIQSLKGHLLDFLM